MQTTPSPQQPLRLLLILGVLWGSGYSLARFATTHGVSPLGYAFWQSIGPAVLLLVCCIFSRQTWHYRFKDMLFFLLLGLIGIAIPNTTMYIVSQHLPAGLLAVIVNTAPIFIYVIAFLTAKEHFNLSRLGAVVLCVSGLYCIALQAAVVPEHHHLPWLMIALVSPLCFAITAIIVARYQPTQISELQSATSMLFAATLWLLPVLIFNHDFYRLSLVHYPPQNIAIVSEILLSSMGYIIFFRLLHQAGAVYYSLVSGIVAVMGIVWGLAFFHENFSIRTSIGMVLIIIAVVLINLKK